MNPITTALQTAVMVARRAVGDATFNFLTSTNKSVGLAAALGLAWVLELGALRISPTAATIALAVAFAADVCATAWWKYAGPLPIDNAPHYETPVDAIEHMISVGVDPVEVERIFDVRLIDYTRLYPQLQTVETVEAADPETVR
ncbi:hypothetical protein OG618_37735 (plasmid) [Kitasatospora sp. NBC_01246]|uniref:hypothetical protein n=1 Tax=Kitasatospora sp. NBC_01246 TaxID=2903570 RepID=UPI002E309E04|nr:hypothetical protein [Kitasatospora sp. NBC_01246]